MRRYAIVFTVAAMMIIPEAMVYAQSRASYRACEALSERRGSGPEAGNRTHNAFMRDCLAGTISFAAARTPAPASEAHVQSFDRCEALSVERGSGPESGGRNHRSFMRQCMAGRIR
jgi:hypothetical protein